MLSVSSPVQQADSIFKSLINKHVSFHAYLLALGQLANMFTNLSFQMRDCVSWKRETDKEGVPTL